MATRSVVVPITASNAGLIKALKKAQRETETRTQRMQRRVGQLNRAMGKAFAIGGAAAVAGGAAIIKSSVDVASNLEQSAGAVETIWGKQAGAVEKWAARNQKSLRATKQESLDMAVTLGQNGIKSTAQLDKIMSSGNDLVAAFGGNMKDFTEAQSAVFRGEYDSMQKWVPALSAASVEAEAAAKGISKQQAALNIINRDGLKVQGQAKRESKTFAGTQKNLGIIMERVQETIGKKVIPLLVKLGDWFLKEGVPALEKMAPVVRDVLVAAFAKLKAIFDAIYPVFKSVFGFLKENPGVAKAAAIAIGSLVAVVEAWYIGMKIAAAYTAVSTAVTKAWTFGVKAATLAQKLFNIQMLMNPVTLVVLAIVALIAIIVLLVKNWDKVTAVLGKVWDKVKQFGAFLKDSFGKLVSAAGEKAKALGSKIWSGIKTIGPKLKTIGKWIFNHIPHVWLAKKIFGLFKRIAPKIWDGIKTIGAKLKTIGAWIWNRFYPGPLLGLGKKVLRTAKSIGGKIWTGIKSVGGSLRGIGGWVWGKVVGGLDTIATRFKNRGGSILRGFIKAFKAAWKEVKEIAKTPLNGLIGVANKFLAKVGKIPGTPKWFDTGIAKFARGGAVFGPGGGKDDKVRAYLSNGEHVLTAEEVKKAGGHKAIYRLREMLKKGRVDTATGGGDIGWSNIGFAKGGALSASSIKRAKEWAKSQVGHPYYWGGVGPVGYDCSGFMSAITNILRGLSPHSRVGATATFPWAGFKPGYGQFTIGSFRGSPGHMAGTIDGLNVESAGGVGVRVGKSARGANDKSFNTVAHLGSNEWNGSGGGSWWDKITKPLKWVKDKISGFLGKIKGEGFFNTEILKNMAKYLFDKVKDKIPGLATGGIVKARPGGTLALLGEGGQDEAVVPLTRGTRGRVVEVHHHYEIEIKAGVGDPVAIGRSVSKALDAYVGAGGRVRTK